MTAAAFFPFRLDPDPVPTPPAPPPPPVVLIYGDSFTHHGTWHLTLRDRMRIDVANNATSGSGFAQIGWRSTFPHAVVTRTAPDAAVVVVFGGVNDANHGQTPEAVELAAVVTLAAARAVNPRAVVVLVAPQWPALPPTRAVVAMRDRLRRVAADMGVTYVDPLPWFDGRHDLIEPDQLHPTEAGQQHIADRMAPIIAAALDRYTDQEAAA